MLDFEVDNDFGVLDVRSHVVVDHCDVARATASCQAPGCTAATSLAIVPAGCRYSRLTDGR